MNAYTLMALASVPLTVLLDVVVLRTRVLVGRPFWIAYAIVLFFQLVSNGLLSGLHVVDYDPAAILSGGPPVFLGDWRVAYAPVEDLLFGFSLVTQTLAWWTWWGRRIES